MLLQDLVCFSQSCSNYVVCQSWDLLEFLYTKYPSSHFIYFNLNVASLCYCLYIFNFLMSIYLIAKIKQNKYLNSPVFGSWAHAQMCLPLKSWYYCPNNGILQATFKRYLLLSCPCCRKSILILSHKIFTSSS